MTPPRKYQVTEAELVVNKLRLRTYRERRNAGWTHEKALQPISIAHSSNARSFVYDRPMVVGTVYTIADHISIRGLARDGLSVAGLLLRFPHIPETHLADIVKGTNYCED